MTLSVDALTTGYAFVLEEMLKVRGLASGDYTLVKAGGFQQRFDGLMAGSQAGTLSVPPFTLLGGGEGFQRSRHRHLRFAATTRASSRPCARSGRRTTVTNWSATSGPTSLRSPGSTIPANKAEALDRSSKKHLPGATVEIAAKSYDVFLDPQTGFDRNAAIDVAGAENRHRHS